MTGRKTKTHRAMMKLARAKELLAALELTEERKLIQSARLSVMAHERNLAKLTGGRGAMLTVMKGHKQAKRERQAPAKEAAEERGVFYTSAQWRAVRYKALVKHGRKCLCCGATPEQGATMHVDHIQPRSLRPDLALDLNNLQILCAECNLGKSNLDDTDFR